MLELLVPAPRKIEVDTVDLASPPAAVWEHVRHGDLGQSPLVRALFALRTLPSRIGGAPPSPSGIRLDDMRSTPEQPGFQILGDDPPCELAVGAIGQVWQLDIPFVHVSGPEAFADFDEPGYIKVAWAVGVEPLGATGTRVVVELRVDTTDDTSWERFARYWRLIGPGSHFIRQALLADLTRRFGGLHEGGQHEEARVMPGDERLVEAAAQLTRGITVAASPEAVWPWLLQMGCRRGGFYAIDALDNGFEASAREVHPELSDLAVGDVIAATPEGADGFEVLAIEPNRGLVLGGLFDVTAERQLPFASERPSRYWHVTWAFELERLDKASTRLRVRARAAFSPSERLHVAWIRPVHRLMQRAQLAHLAERVEATGRHDRLGDVLAGVGGAAVMALAWLSPFLRPARSHWGLSAEEACVPRPGDELVPAPRWAWTHAIEIDAPAERVWPWIAQLGADRAGFYSYQWLENLAGCGVHNAEALHPEWAHEVGSALFLHPKMPPLRVVALTPGHALVAFAPCDDTARAAGKPWATASWAFLVEPLTAERSRVVSRFRTACSDDLSTRLAQGPVLLEPIGFAMDRRMLLGLRERVARQEVLRGEVIRQHAARQRAETVRPPLRPR